jgi:flagellin-like protein
MVKGISPIVAVVLMIAVAISLGVLVTIWITSWVTTQTTSSGLACVVNTNYIIDSATYYNSSNELRIKVTNKGQEGLWGFGFALDNGTDVRQFNWSNVYGQDGINQSNKLRSQQSLYLWVNSSSIAIDGRAMTNEFGLSLREIALTNEACPTAPAAKTTTISKVI